MKKPTPSFPRHYKKYALILIFLLTTCVAAHASLQTAESLMVQGRTEEALTALDPYIMKNDPHALYLTGVIYLSPSSKQCNQKKGIDFLERAVFQNYGPALDELAGLYLAGEGVEKNEAKALYYYTQASHLGYGPSQFNCGIMHKEGQGTEKNLEKAYLYLSLASLNHKDLGDVTINAAQHRDEIVPFLNPTQRQDVLRLVNYFTLPFDPPKRTKVTP
jgi:hypothetical protein